MTWIRVHHPPPHDKLLWVEVEVHIIRNSDGVERTYRDMDELLRDDGETWSDYMWRDGNWSCDCNRYLFFQRAAGEEEIDDDGPCGHDAYTVWIVNPADGSIIYDERKGCA